MTREEAITRLHWLKRELIKGTDMNEPIDMAISALQEPLGLCEHCIWNDCNYNKLDYEAPYAQTEAVQGWIQCSKRLPKAEDCPMDCMVTRRSKYVGNYTDMAVAEADGTWTHEDWKAITIDGNATCISTRDADIIAWMPLPTPYKGGEK